MRSSWGPLEVNFGTSMKYVASLLRGAHLNTLKWHLGAVPLGSDGQKGPNRSPKGLRKGPKREPWRGAKRGTKSV